MRILIVEDDSVSRKFLLRFLSQVGNCDVVTDGMEAIEYLMIALDHKCYYNLICLDIVMPEKTQKTIEKLESEWKVPLEKRAKIIMTTNLDDTLFSVASVDACPEKYSIKPIDTARFRDVMIQLGLKEEWVCAHR